MNLRKLARSLAANAGLNPAHVNVPDGQGHRPAMPHGPGRRGGRLDRPVGIGTDAGAAGARTIGPINVGKPIPKGSGLLLDRGNLAGVPNVVSLNGVTIDTQALYMGPGVIPAAVLDVTNMSAQPFELPRIDQTISVTVTCLGVAVWGVVLVDADVQDFCG